MSETDRTLLDPAFRAKADRLYEHLAARYAIVMVPYSSVRTVWEQAVLWRQSRPTLVIKSAVERLRSSGARYLADVLEEVGPQPGKIGHHVTNALPGYSWHNWGLAEDAYWEVSPGKASWSSEEVIPFQGSEINGYRLFAEVAPEFELYTGGGMWGWDWPHVQNLTASSPSKAGHSAEFISHAMQEKFGEAPK